MASCTFISSSETEDEKMEVDDNDITTTTKQDFNTASISTFPNTVEKSNLFDYKRFDEDFNELVQFHDVEEPAAENNGGLNIEAPPRKEFRLRSYQEELVELAEEGKNVIICAPPGSGKTVVAADIILNYLEKNCNIRKKVLFFTPGGALAQQQQTRIHKFLPRDFRVDFRCGREENSSLLEMKDTDVIVLTPQILLNEFKSNDEMKMFRQIDEFDLIVFDECHHCFKGHPYNVVMRHYFDLKYASDTPTGLPQVVGLTATLGVGKNPKNVVGNIKQLCANLDATDGIVTVQNKENLSELHKYTPHPEKSMISFEKRKKDDKFSKRLISLLLDINEMLNENGVTSDLPYYEASDFSIQSFKHWCRNLKNKISAKEFNEDRDAYSCVELIEKCAAAMDSYEKCLAVNAIRCLQEHLDTLEMDKLTETEKKLFSLTEVAIAELEHLSKDPACENSNLKNIEKRIVQRFKTQSDSRGMLMAETRECAAMLKGWMEENETLKFLNAEIFMGVANTSGTGVAGLTHKKQEKLIKDFREGKHKLLICTPESAGEGMDIPDCNLVINYNFLQNEIGMVQVQGRVRHHEGEMVHLASIKGEQRDQLNMMRSLLMEETVVKIQQEITDDINSFRADLANLQKQARTEQKAKLLQKLRKRQRDTNGDEYLLQCKKCKTDLCSSYDIKIATGGHHVNFSKEFQEKYERREHKKKDSMGADWKKRYKVYCKKCPNSDWGIEATWKSLVTVPLIKCDSLRMVSTKDRKVATPKKWHQAPFKPQDVDLDEIFNDLDHLINREEAGSADETSS